MKPDTPDRRLVWLNAGETSGDIHGAMLMRALRKAEPDLRFIGMGGPAMRAEGLECVARTEDLSVMGFTEVLAKLPTVLRLLRLVRQELQARQPFALVLIDSPGFNFRVAKMASEMNTRVFYYISPKVWAWRQDRVRFLKRYVDRMLLILPFEQDFFDAWSMPATFVGNPLVEETRKPELLAIEPVPGRVGLLPGSRRREIESLMPCFVEAAQYLSRVAPSTTFHLMLAPGVAEETIRRHWPDSIPLVLHAPEERYAAMRSCELLIAASGTVTLESSLLQVPTVVTYRFSSLTFALARMVVKVPFVSLPNLILGRQVFPELLQSEATGKRIAETALDWLRNPAEAARLRHELAEVATRLGPPGAASRAAEIILSGLRRDAPERDERA